MLSAVSSIENNGVRTLNLVTADDTFFIHLQIQSKYGLTFMRSKKRQLY